MLEVTIGHGLSLVSTWNDATFNQVFDVSRERLKELTGHFACATRADAFNVPISVTVADVRAIIRCFNEVANSAAYAEWEFQTIVGFSRVALRQMLCALVEGLVIKP